MAGANFAASEPLAAHAMAPRSPSWAEVAMKVLTANRLTDGEAVWYTADGGWAETLGDAEVAA